MTGVRFTLTHEIPRKPYGPGRIAVVKAFLDRRSWTREEVDRFSEMMSRRGWDRFPEWQDTLDLAHDLISAWKEIDDRCSEGNLRFGLVRKTRRRRLEELAVKVRGYKERRAEAVKTKIGWKSYKSTSAARKQWGRLDAAMKVDTTLLRLKCLESKLTKALTACRSRS